jgi:hypothetical protein
MPKSSKQKLAYQAEYNSRPEVIDKIGKSVQARRDAVKAGKVRPGDGKDVGHKRALDNGGGNENNTQVESIKSNRGWRKGQSGYKVPNK